MRPGPTLRRRRARAFRPLPTASGFDELWSGLGGDAVGVPAAPTSFFRPCIDVVETPSQIVVTAELPGLERGDFELELEDDLLTLRGQKRLEAGESARGLRHLETRGGRFERRLRLPHPVPPEDVKATYRNGVLEVVLPAGASRAREIPVTRG